MRERQRHREMERERGIVRERQRHREMEREMGDSERETETQRDGERGG